MKVIVTGATGRAGKEIVKHCIADARITKIVILTRRAVAGPVESNPKTEVVMHQDFSRYSDELLRRLEGAEACLWAIGARAEEVGNDKVLSRRVAVEFPLAAAAIMSERLADKTPAGRRFTFVFCSDKHAERSPPPRPLLFLGDLRRHKGGEADKGLVDLAMANPLAFAVCILRPCAFANSPANAPKKRRFAAGLSSSSTASIEPAQLARAAVRVACEGCKDRIIENDMLLKM